MADPDGDRPLDSLADAPGARKLESLTVDGQGEPLTELVLPYRGQLLVGPTLEDRLASWERAGVLEPSAADAVREVAAHPEWLRLEGRTVAVLGAGAEMGPLGPLLRWGATVAAVDLPTPAIWERVLGTARAAAGRLLVPVAPGTGDAGVDLLAEVPETADWLAGLDGRLVVGNYLYADGGTHVRVSVAADALASRVTAARPDTAVAFLATPTDVFAVPGDAVDHSGRAYADRSGAAKLVGRPLRWVSRGRLLHRQYPPGMRTRASPTAWCPSRVRTTRWRNGSSAGVPASTGPRAARCRSTSRRRRGLARSSRTGRWPQPSPARIGSGSRCSTRRRPTR